MFLFENDKCPVCNEDFKNGDDIVVCPHCGTPHHRACYNETKSCANKALHGRGFKFERSAPPEEAPQQPNEEEEKKPQPPFMQLIENNIDVNEVNKLVDESVKQEDAPQEVTIDGVSVHDVSQVIGNNIKYYLPRFITNKGLGWNWGAFVFGPFYYFFRKMNIQGFTFLAIQFALNIVVENIFKKPIEAFINLFQSISPNRNRLTTEQLLQLIQSPQFAEYSKVMLIEAGITILLGIVMGICANKMYKKKVITTVKRVDERLKEGNTFTVSPMMNSDVNLSQNDMRRIFLARQGGVNWFTPAIIYICIAVLTMF